MPTQIVMDHTGDTRHQFDPAAAAAEAEARFKELMGVDSRPQELCSAGGHIYRK
jgi:hypothetical protein